LSVLSSLHQFSDWGLLALRLGVGSVFWSTAARSVPCGGCNLREFEFLLLVCAIALLLLGAGKFALDRLLFGI